MGGGGGSDSAPSESTASDQADGIKAAGETGAVPATFDVPDEREVGEAGTVTGSPFSWGTRRCYVSLNRAVGWVGGLGGRRRGPIAEGPAQRVSAMGRK